MHNEIFHELPVWEITKDGKGCRLSPVGKRVITETHLKITVNGNELVTISCLNRDQDKLAIGYLYNERIIDSPKDVKNISFNDKTAEVTVSLREGISCDSTEGAKNLTSSGGRYRRNPFLWGRQEAVQSKATFPLDGILNLMTEFTDKSELYTAVGGVHSVLFYTPDFEILTEDIGRHNCYDKIAGFLLMSGKQNLAGKGIVFISGRISSEIMAKIIRIGVPVAVSKSTPTTAAVELALRHNVTVLGYVREKSGFIYSCPERIIRS